MREEGSIPGRYAPCARWALPLLTMAAAVVLPAPARTVSLGDSAARPCTIRVLEQDLRHTTIEITIGAFTTEEVPVRAERREVIAVPGMLPIAIRGAPDLPRLVRTLHVPPHRDVRHVVLAADRRAFDGIHVAPSRGPIAHSQDPATIPRAYGSWYTRDVLFPGKEFEVFPPFRLRKARGIKFQFSPFRYNPATRRLIVTKRLVVRFLYGDPGQQAGTTRRAETAPFTSAPPRRDVFHSLYPRVFLNYASDFLSDPASSPTKAGAGNASATGVPEHDNMLIVTTPHYAPALADFIAWKEVTGWNVELNTAAASNGVAAVQNAIQAKYDNDGLAYILLVGDLDDVPSPLVSVLLGRPSDPSYALLEGDDVYGDAIVSRISVSDTGELRNQLNKIMIHGQAGFAHNGWIHRALVVAGSDYGGTPHADTIEAGMLAHPGEFQAVIKLLADAGAGSADIKDAVENVGVNMFTYVGHASEAGFQGVPFTTVDAAALQPASNRFPMVHAVACNSGNFGWIAGDCFAEAMLKAGSPTAPAGAVAMLASSETMLVGMGEIAQKAAFTNLYYRPDIDTFGELCFEATVLAMNRLDPAGAELLYRQWHLFGDASSPLWKRSPVRLQVVMPAAVTEGDGILSEAGAIVLPSALSTNVTIALRSSNSNELVIATGVVVNAGETNVPFDLSVQDDTFLDGSRFVTVEAESLGPDLGLGTAAVRVHDNESTFLTVSCPGPFREDDGVLEDAGVVSAGAAPVADVTVTMLSGDLSEAIVEDAVVITGGATSATFRITIVDDAEIDGTGFATIVASVENWETGSNTIEVADNETAALTVELPAWLGEADGMLPGAGRIGIPGTLPTNRTVRLSCNDTTEIAVASVVVVTAGHTWADFDIEARDDLEVDGAQTVSVTATSSGFSNGVAFVTVHDDEVQAFAFDSVTSPQTNGVPFPVSIRALDTDGATAAYTGSVELAALCPTGAIAVLPSTTAAFVQGGWSGEILLRSTLQQLRLVCDDRMGRVGQSSAFHTVLRAIPPAFDPSPHDGAESVEKTAGLSWKLLESGLLVNGGFETGDYTGWAHLNSGASSFALNDGTLDPPGADTPLAPFDGDFDVASISSAAGRCTLWQEFVIPHDAGSARLEWWDRIRNHRACFMDPTHEFRVQVRDASGTVLAELFSTNPGDAAFSDWTRRSEDVSRFIGRRVRIVFEVQNTPYPLTVYLDAIRVTAELPQSPCCEVYFGLNPTPGPPEFLGSTTNAAWSLPPLASYTPYYWQVVTREGASTTPGPIWQFKTLGMDRFEWAPIPSPQEADLAFPVTIMAKDAGGVTLPHFEGCVRLSAWYRSDSLPQVCVAEIDTGTEDAVEFVNVSKSMIDVSGWRISVYDSSWPAPRLTFTIPAGSLCPTGTVFVLREQGVPPGTFPELYAGNNIYWGGDLNYLAILLQDAAGSVADFVAAAGADPSSVSEPRDIPPEEWTGPSVAAANVLCRIGNSDDNRRSDWAACSNATIGALNMNLAVPFVNRRIRIPVVPMDAGPLSSGVWQGNVTVRRSATALRLQADDADGTYSGLSNPFEVTPSSLPLLLMIR